MSSLLKTLSSSRAAAAQLRDKAHERAELREQSHAEHLKVVKERNRKLSEEYTLYLKDAFLGPLLPLLDDMEKFTSSLDDLMSRCACELEELKSVEDAEAEGARSRGEEYRFSTMRRKVDVMKERGYPMLVVGMALDLTYVTLDQYHRPRTEGASVYSTHWSGVALDEDGLVEDVIEPTMEEYVDHKGVVRHRPENPTLPKVTLVEGSRVSRPEGVEGYWCPTEEDLMKAHKKFRDEGGFCALDMVASESFSHWAGKVCRKMREHLVKRASTEEEKELVENEPSESDAINTSFYWLVSTQWTGKPTEHRVGGTEVRLIFHAPKYGAQMRELERKRKEFQRRMTKSGRGRGRGRFSTRK